MFLGEFLERFPHINLNIAEGQKVSQENMPLQISSGIFHWLPESCPFGIFWAFVLKVSGDFVDATYLGQFATASLYILLKPDEPYIQLMFGRPAWC